MSAPAVARFTPSKPCPICGGHDQLPRGHTQRCYGYLDSTGKYARCTREEHAGGLPQNPDETYSHKLSGSCRCGIEHNPAPAPAPTSSAARLGPIEAEYHYADEAGGYLFTVRRHRAPKTFRQGHYGGGPGAGSWAYGLGDTRRVLYRLPELRTECELGARIYVTEGEKDAEALVAAGACATCNPMGAGKWQDDYAESLTGASHVVIVADKDEAGYKHAEQVRASLERHGLAVEVVEAAKGKDAHDHLTAGFGVEDFLPVTSQEVTCDPSRDLGDPHHEGVVTRVTLPEGGKGTFSVEEKQRAREALDGVLGQVSKLIDRFVHLESQELAALVLWIAHTHAFEAAITTPYVALTSPERGCGKSRVLEVCEPLVRKGVMVVNASTSGLFRMIEKDRPTLLFDEVDAIFKRRGEDTEEMRGVLNAGFRKRGGSILRVVGASGTKLEPQRFSVFCPKMLAAIGESVIPDTVLDRSIQLRMNRASPGTVEKLRERSYPQEAEAVRGQLAEALGPLIDELAGFEPDVPEELDDRAADIWEPLLAIADAAGSTWPEVARDAARTLSGQRKRDGSARLAMLRGMRQVFNARGPRVLTKEAIEDLNADDEAPWASWNGGQGLRPKDLAKNLGEFRIESKSVRPSSGGKPAKGYSREDFEDAFASYLPPPGAKDGSQRSQPQGHVDPGVTSGVTNGARKGSHEDDLDRWERMAGGVPSGGGGS